MIVLNSIDVLINPGESLLTMMIEITSYISIIHISEHKLKNI